MPLAPTRLRGAQFAKLVGALLLQQRGDMGAVLRRAFDRYGPAICVRPERGWFSRRERRPEHPDRRPEDRPRPKEKISEVWLVADPAIIEALLIREHRSFAKDPLTRELEDVLGLGLLVSEGDAWRHDHKLVQPVLGAGAMRRRLGEVTEIVDTALGRWPAEGDLDCAKLFGPLTLEVVSRIALGLSLHDDAPLVGAALEQILDYYAGFGGPGVRAPAKWRTPARRRFEGACAELRSLTTRLIDRRAAEPCTAADDDVLGRLLADHRRSPEALPAARVADQVMTLMLAGNETTTLGLAYALHALAHNPEAQVRWHAEADAAAEHGLELDRLPWTRGIWRETLRMFPPAAGVARVARSDVDLAGLRIPARSLVVVPALAIHRFARWFPEPDAFVPQRFIDPPTWPKLAYLPFGAGPRVCIGSHLADIEALVALARIGRRYRLEPRPGAKPLRFKLSVTMRPADGVPIRLVPR